MGSRLLKRGLIFLLITGGFFLLHNVSRKITPADRVVFTKLLEDDEFYRLEKNKNDFSKEIEQVKAIQILIQDLAPNGTSPIPQNYSRQPVDLLNAKSGLCYDRAYTLAKLYRYLGWETRHVALYQNDPGQYNLLELFNRKIKSHASIEVKTQRGWLIIDPDEPWISLAVDSSVHCYVEVQKAEKTIVWLQSPTMSMSWHLTKLPIVVYGLYSRHGRFFPPYNFIPDVNWRELLHNI